MTSPFSQPRAARPHMPGYGLLPEDQGEGLLSWSWAVERMRGSRSYWVASSRPDGTPHLVAVWGVWLDNTFYFSTGGASVKNRNLQRDARCSVARSDAEEAVVVEGLAAAVSDMDERQRVVERYAAKYGLEPPNPAENPLLAVRVRRAFGFISDEHAFTGTATRWTF